MSKLFIHHPVFRLFSPLFGGSLVYLLILLSNNDVAQLDDEFLTQELYFCIGLSYLIQEFSRLLLILFSKIDWKASLVIQLMIQVLVSVVFTFLLVSALVYLYYQQMLGYAPNLSEMMRFNIICAVISLMYISLYLSHQLLHQINTTKISVELEKKTEIQEDYQQFVRGINPDLLFEGLEALIVQMKLVGKTNTSGDPDELLDVLSIVYRYLLTNKSKELVQFDAEKEAMIDLVALFDYLPYSKVKLDVEVNDPGATVPGTFLYLVQELVKVTIQSPMLEQLIEVRETESHLLLTTVKNDRVSKEFSLDLPEALNRSYAFYTDQPISVEENEETRSILIPKIILNTD